MGLAAQEAGRSQPCSHRRTSQVEGPDCSAGDLHQTTRTFMSVVAIQLPNNLSSSDNGRARCADGTEGQITRCTCDVLDSVDTPTPSTQSLVHGAARDAAQANLEVIRGTKWAIHLVSGPRHMKDH